jgi:hypothetical protein
MGKPGLTRLIIAQTWGKAPPSPLYYSLCMATWQHPNVILSQDSQVGSPKILEIKLLAILEAHNILCRPLIEVRFKETL